VWYSWPSTEGAPEIIAAETKDILMVNWSWGGTETAIDQLKAYGWKQIMGNFNGERKYEQWLSLLDDSTVLGAEVSTWCRANEYVFGLNNIMLNTLVAQQLLWSGKERPLAQVYQHLAESMPGIRTQISGKRLPSTDVREGREGYEVIPLKLQSPDGTDLAVDLAVDRAADMAVDPAADMAVDPAADPASLPESPEPVLVTVNSNAASILFTHVCSGKGEKLSLERTHYLQDKAQLIGYYRVHYADGLVETIPVRYGYNITHAGSGYQDQLYFAKTVNLADPGSEEPFLASLYEWVSSRPNRQIDFIDMMGVDTKSDVFPILLDIAMVKPPFVK
jgi:hypothetical protein